MDKKCPFQTNRNCIGEKCGCFDNSCYECGILAIKNNIKDINERMESVHRIYDYITNINLSLDNIEKSVQNIEKQIILKMNSGLKMRKCINV